MLEEVADVTAQGDGLRDQVGVSRIDAAVAVVAEVAYAEDERADAACFPLPSGRSIIKRHGLRWQSQIIDRERRERLPFRQHPHLPDPPLQQALINSFPIRP